jgi:MazG family protein
MTGATSGGVPPPEGGPAIDRLVAIMRILRSDRGCPWDREQTLTTLKPYLVEEAHEVLDAIDAGDRAKLCEELGDLLLQVVFQAQLCAEEGAFTFDDVAAAIAEKLIRRHPHVFGSVKVDGSSDVVRNWEQIKKSEGGGAPRSVLDGVPKSLPALHRAQLIQERAARVGFDWDRIDGALAKLQEEIGEVRAAAAAGDLPAAGAELGDVLFAAVNVSRFLERNPEDLLHGTVAKFIGRFRIIERLALERGLVLADCSLEQLDAMWDEAKATEK